MSFILLLVMCIACLGIDLYVHRRRHHGAAGPTLEDGGGIPSAAARGGRVVGQIETGGHR